MVTAFSLQQSHRFVHSVSVFQTFKSKKNEVTIKHYRKTWEIRKPVATIDSFLRDIFFPGDLNCTFGRERYGKYGNSGAG